MSRFETIPHTIDALEGYAPAHKPKPHAGHCQMAMDFKPTVLLKSLYQFLTNGGLKDSKDIFLPTNHSLSDPYMASIHSSCSGESRCTRHGRWIGDDIIVKTFAESSGRGAWPSKYRTTSRMLGRADGCGCEHISPSFSAISASPLAYSPPNPASTVSRIEPFCQLSTTQSTNMNCSPCRATVGCSTGLRPQTTYESSEREDIGGGGYPPRPGKLRREITQRPHHVGRLRIDVVIVQPRETEISQLGIHLAVQQHIARLNPHRDTLHDSEPLGPPESRFVVRAVVQVLVEATVGNEVIDQEKLPLSAAVAEQLHNIAVAEAADAGDLHHELPHPLPRLVGNPLHCHLCSRIRQRPSVDLPEAAYSQQLPLAEPVGGSEEVSVREPVRPELHLPILAQLRVLAPPLCRSERHSAAANATNVTNSMKNKENSASSKPRDLHLRRLKFLRGIAGSFE
ncbi:hypothetical protein ACMD2_21708 [Ananas comosus]|uniref:Uncharacterized protein n=1 Tax=Ananas comosus TaxID=4615 RepID=A0A199W5L1_ANACO|nr:hypothetical protein ACMD2_21708 [Ananas comosus]